MILLSDPDFETAAKYAVSIATIAPGFYLGLTQPTGVQDYNLMRSKKLQCTVSSNGYIESELISVLCPGIFELLY
jgi:hypothetical protein